VEPLQKGNYKNASVTGGRNIKLGIPKNWRKTCGGGKNIGLMSFEEFQKESEIYLHTT
jgi:hypothetical protein